MMFLDLGKLQPLYLYEACVKHWEGTFYGCTTVERGLECTCSFNDSPLNQEDTTSSIAHSHGIARFRGLAWAITTTVCRKFVWGIHVKVAFVTSDFDTSLYGGHDQFSRLVIDPHYQEVTTLLMSKVNIAKNINCSELFKQFFSISLF